jgi:rare lipoprotein A
LYNPETHVGQLVRINDRGPFVDGRELDVSYLVACRLGMQEKGVSRLRIELLEVPKRP